MHISFAQTKPNEIRVFIFVRNSSISQNMAIRWLIGTSVGFRLHLGRYSHHTPVLMGLQAPPAYPEFRLHNVATSTDQPTGIRGDGQSDSDGVGELLPAHERQPSFPWASALRQYPFSPVLDPTQ